MNHHHFCGNCRHTQIPTPLYNTFFGSVVRSDGDLTTLLRKIVSDSGGSPNLREHDNRNIDVAMRCSKHHYSRTLVRCSYHVIQ